jgi:hypothetical protein
MTNFLGVYTHIYLEKLHTKVSLLSIFINLSFLTILLIVLMAVARSLKFAVLGTGRMVSPPSYCLGIPV